MKKVVRFIKRISEGNRYSEEKKTHSLPRLLDERSNSMVIQCVVYQYTNRQGERARDNGVSFFRYPKDSKNRKACVREINRDEWVPTEFSRVCSEHFTGGGTATTPIMRTSGPPFLSTNKSQEVTLISLGRRGNAEKFATGN